jgi:hypothetical protein
MNELRAYYRRETSRMVRIPIFPTPMYLKGFHFFNLTYKLLIYAHKGKTHQKLYILPLRSSRDLSRTSFCIRLVP